MLEDVAIICYYRLLTLRKRGHGRHQRHRPLPGIRVDLPDAARNKNGLPKTSAMNATAEFQRIFAVQSSNIPFFTVCKTLGELWMLFDPKTTRKKRRLILRQIPGFNSCCVAYITVTCWNKRATPCPLGRPLSGDSTCSMWWLNIGSETRKVRRFRYASTYTTPEPPFS